MSEVSVARLKQTSVEIAHSVEVGADVVCAAKTQLEEPAFSAACSVRAQLEEPTPSALRLPKAQIEEPTPSALRLPKTQIEEPALCVAYAHDGTLEGLLSAIFEAYVRHDDPLDFDTEDNIQLRLGQELHFVETNEDHANRVARGIIRAGGAASFDVVRKVSLSSTPGAGRSIFLFVRRLMKERKYLLDDLADPVIGRMMELAKSIDNECEKMRQFMRFQHLENGGWFAICNPRDAVVPLIMDWFSARFNDQAFVIYDEAHNMAGVYEGRQWYLVHADSFSPSNLSSEEEFMQTAWRRFYQVVSIDERYNPELRRTHMPVRFWKNLTEMQTGPQAALYSKK